MLFVEKEEEGDDENVSEGENKDNLPYILPITHTPTIHTTPPCKLSTIKDHSPVKQPQVKLRGWVRTPPPEDTLQIRKVSQAPIRKACNKNTPVRKPLIIVSLEEAKDRSRQLLVLNMKIRKQQVRAL